MNIKKILYSMFIVINLYGAEHQIIPMENNDIDDLTAILEKADTCNFKNIFSTLLFIKKSLNQDGALSLKLKNNREIEDMKNKLDRELKIIFSAKLKDDRDMKAFGFILFGIIGLWISILFVIKNMVVRLDVAAFIIAGFTSMCIIALITCSIFEHITKFQQLRLVRFFLEDNRLYYNPAYYKDKFYEEIDGEAILRDQSQSPIERTKINKNFSPRGRK